MAGEYFQTPVGRIVYNRIWDRVTKDAEGEPLTNRDGSLRTEQVILHAVAKDNPDLQNFFNKIRTEAKEVSGSQCDKPGFNWKCYDGDDPKYNGKIGYAGHWIFKYVNGLPESVKVYDKTVSEIITDPRACKCGDFITCLVYVRSNTSTKNPGIHLNLKAVRWYALGEEITSFDVAQVFQNSAISDYVPHGVLRGSSGTTLMPGPPGVSGTTSMPGPPDVSGTTSMPGPPGVSGTTSNTFQNPDLRYRMTELAAGYSREQYLNSGSGWSDEKLIQAGLMVVVEG